jgi:hypothetical protein
MASIFQIPLSAKPLKETISLNGVNYGLALRWNNISNNWILDIYTSGGDKLITGIPLITGTDLLGQFQYLDIAKQAVILAVTDPFGSSHIDDVPSKTNLGIDSHLYYITP